MIICILNKRMTSLQSKTLTVIILLMFITLTSMMLNLKNVNAKLTFQVNELKGVVRQQTNKILQNNTKIHEYEMKIISDYIRSVNYKVFPDMSKLLSASFINASRKYNIPLELLIGLATVESSFKYDAVSEKNAIGIMQIEPKTWTKILIDKNIITCRQDLFNPTKNISSGAYILKHYHKQEKKQDKEIAVKDINRKIKNKSKHFKYAITRYLGGISNNHFSNVMIACDKYKQYTKTY